MEKKPKLNYRTEIDGLRAIAVIAVVIFHLGEAFLPGGYLGVDVFFVISGFLITSILCRQMEDGNFSMFAFLGRRLRRLYPALVIMVGVTVLVGAWVLMQPERGALTMQGLAAVFSFENIWIWRTTGGYWDSSTEYISLLHTWSLSLEEQFYLVFPLMLLAVYRWIPKALMGILLFGLFSSVVLCCLASVYTQNAAFYLLPTRMWELLIGAVLAVWMKKLNLSEEGGKRVFDLLAASGIVLVVFSMVYLSSERNYYGLMSVIPCIGAALILRYAHVGLFHRCLSYRPLAYIGNISYSLYLWHWPVIVYMKYLDPHYNMLIAVVVFTTLSILSYHFVENPFRDQRSKVKRTLAIPMVICGLCFIPICMMPQNPLINGYGDIDSPEAGTSGAMYEASDRILAREVNNIETEKSQISLAIFGSSHARVWGQSMEDFCEEQGLEFISYATSGVFVSMDNSAIQPDQDKIRAQRFDMLMVEKPDVVFYSERWEHEMKSLTFEADLRKALEKLIQSGAKVVVMSQIPKIDLPIEYEKNLRSYLLSQQLKGKRPEVLADVSVIEANSMVSKIVEDYRDRGVDFIDVHPAMVTEGKWVRMVEAGKFFYADSNHLNDAGCAYLFEQILKSRLLSHMNSLKGESE